MSLVGSWTPVSFGLGHYRTRWIDLRPANIASRSNPGGQTVSILAFEVPVNSGRTLEPPQRLPGGQLRFDVVGFAGISYVLEVSTNLTQWSPVGTNAGPRFDWTETDPSAAPGRFYRAMVPP